MKISTTVEDRNVPVVPVIPYSELKEGIYRPIDTNGFIGVEHPQRMIVNKAGKKFLVSKNGDYIYSPEGNWTNKMFTPVNEKITLVFTS